MSQSAVSAMNAPSYAAGSSARPLLHHTLGDCLAAMAAAAPAREALISCHQGLRYTYADLQAQVAQTAAALAATGVAPGDRVAFCSTSRAEWLVTHYAVASIGGVLVGINPAFRAPELEFILRNSGASVLVISADASACDAALAWRAPVLPLLRHIIWLGSAPPAGTMPWRDLLRAGAAAQAASTERPPDRPRGDAAIAPERACAILYTSGTTGMPKGATLSHLGMVNSGFSIGERLQYGPADRICLPVPLYHAFGIAVGAAAALLHGSTVVLPAETFEPGAVLTAIERERCTVIYGVPTMFSAQVEHADFAPARVASLRTGIVAGAPCPPELCRRLRDEMHLSDLTVSFGMTETLSTLHTHLGEALADRPAATVGTPLPHVECKIVGTDGATLPRGSSGELCTRGYGTMLGYWNDPAGTAQAIDADGWMHTGDLAVMDEDGCVRIAGRLKEMIIRAGEKVHPADVEQCLAQHPKVQEVHVFGVPDRFYGEELCAWIRLRPGESATVDEMRRHCRGRIATFKVPRLVRFVDQFPRTATGKVQRFRMRELMSAEPGNGHA